MALVLKDRVKQTTTTTGTGSIVLNGNIDGFQTFAAALTDGDTTYYGIFEPSTNEYEVGLGTWTESTATLARTTVLESSNSGSAVSLTAQAEVFITQPAEKAVFQDSNGDVDLGGNKILFGNLYSTTGDLPSASTYHGMFAHVHGTGKAYYAHGGNWIELVNEDTSGNVSMGGNLTVTGDLTVNGTTTTVNTTNTVVTDSLIELANGTTGSPSNDAGIVIERGDSNNAFIGYDESADKFTVGTGTFTGASTGNLTITTGTLVANVEGNVTGNVTGDVTGNADTATALETARNIALAGAVTGNANFDGTGNISITTTATSDPTLTLSGDVTGSATFTNLGNATLSTTIAANSVALGTDTTGNYVATITSGNYLTGGTSGEGSTPTLNVDATSNNTASKVVARDASGNFSAGTITANLTGTASSATNADTVDSLHASQFLRSDASDTMSGSLEISSGTNQPLTLTTSSSGPWAIGLYRSDTGTLSRVYNSTGQWFFEHNPSIAGATNWHSSNDGSGSGLDADLWDGNQFSSYLNQAVLTSSSPTFNNAYISGNVYHNGDSDTYLGFETNQVNLRAGNVEMSYNANGLFLNDGSVREDYDALSGTSPTCNVNSGGAFSLTMSGNTTFSFTSPASGYSTGFVLQLTGNGSTVTWPASVDWAGGTAPDAPASGETDIYVFWTRDGGTTWYGVQSIDAAA